MKAAQPRPPSRNGVLNAVITAEATREAAVKPGELIRQTRQAKGLSLAELGQLTNFSAAQVSRYERGISSLTDVDVLRVFADALGLPHQAFGLVPPPPQPEIRHGQQIGGTADFPRLPGPRVGSYGQEDGEDPVRRRKLLTGLAATAATAAVPRSGDNPAQADEAFLGELLVARLRDAMLGLGDSSTTPPAGGLNTDFTRALADFDACRYASLAVRLPRLIRTGHAMTTSTGDASDYVLLAKSYLLATRMLIKLDEQQLGWMAADRARQLAETSGDVLAVAESARQLAVLARKAGWHEQALTIALSAADHPDLRTLGTRGAAERGLLIQSAAYTVARRGDRDGMRDLTDEAAALAKELGGATLLRDHGGGFSPLTVQLHRISAENYAGDPMAALDAARTISLKALPSVERRSRCLSDVAAALDRLGRRQECVRALLAAEHHAPEETHTRPAVKTLISSLLVSGPTSTELRGLAQRSGVVS
ncbi:helix-turn-helix transcriptional regulator [Streptomyces sp. NPDC006251]|uniref:helix-turn-helix domain-containing protein n=1 Tax=Streptomyces sp. NPDC006251 TaxID=3155718 RepID=UPI0033AA3CE3